MRVAADRVAEVGVQRALQFLKRQAAILKHLFLDGVDGVAGIGNAERLRAGKVVNRAALLQGFSSANAVIYQRGQERQRAAFAVGDVDAVARFDQLVHKVRHLFFEGGIEVIHAGVLGHLAGHRAKLFVS